FRTGVEENLILEYKSIGSAVTDINIGDRVTLYWKLGCGECSYCKAGYDVHCNEPRYVAWNGYSEYVTAPADACLPLPNSISLIEGSLLTDTIGTPLAAVKAADVADKSIAVWGCGPLGLMAIQLCKVYGARWVAGIDPIAVRRNKAHEMGADATIDPLSEDPVAELRSRGRPLGVEASICATPAEGVAELALNTTVPEGRLILIAGAVDGDTRHRWLYRVHYFKRGDYPEISQLAGEHKVALEPLITHTFSLDKIADAFRTRFQTKEQALKVVVIPSKG
ncbi:MAG TPA: hypothetical protein EYP10_15600, partial [Armatimonadetes bacterium]|nr:hypothetical protein [Armatimonadota bacterium]